MLELARQVCEREGLDNVNLQLADALGATDVEADCVVLNMVLHHFSDPALALRLLAKRVKAGGSLLVTELCSHDQSWAREACGDLWLGFEQEDLARWARVAGLVPGTASMWACVTVSRFRSAISSGRLATLTIGKF